MRWDSGAQQTVGTRRSGAYLTVGLECLNFWYRSVRGVPGQKPTRPGNFWIQTEVIRTPVGLISVAIFVVMMRGCLVVSSSLSSSVCTIPSGKQKKRASHERRRAPPCSHWEVLVAGRTGPARRLEGEACARPPSMAAAVVRGGVWIWWCILHGVLVSTGFSNRNII